MKTALLRVIFLWWAVEVCVRHKGSAVISLKVPKKFRIFNALLFLITFSCHFLVEGKRHFSEGLS
jgi:hypothetical protein